MAGSKKHHYIKVMQENPRYFGKWGFKRPQKVIDNLVTLNIGDIDEAADRLVEQGAAGIDRILGSGKVTRKMNLVGVKAITPRAREKVTGIGGTIDLPEE
jgi:large subunit ribosomal protein L15